MAIKFSERLPQVRVTPGLKQALEERARQKNIRLNDAIRQAVVDYVEKVRVPIIGVIRPGPDGEPVIVLNEENQE